MRLGKFFLTLTFSTLLRSVLEQKKTDAEKEFGAIDYDAPVESEKKTIGLGTQVKVLKTFVLFSPVNKMVVTTINAINIPNAIIEWNRLE